MRILENGIYRNATKEEIAAAVNRAEDLKQPITAEERIDALESAILELAEVLFNG